MSNNNSSCNIYNSCGSCLSSDTGCAWCTTDSSCIEASAKSSACATEITGSCDDSYYTIIFIVVLSATLCLCCATCYIRRMRGTDHDLFLEQLLSPLLPNRARQFLFRNSLVEEGESEWMCIVCGFDNKPRDASCIMCGTSHEFSSVYKGNKTLRRSRKKENEETETLSLLHPKQEDIILDIKENLSTINDPELSSLSLSLKYFNADSDKFIHSCAPLTAEKRLEAINFRRINQLSLRQKSARRRKMWQRMYDENTQTMIWVRTPLKEVKVKDVSKGSYAPFGFTPRTSLSKLDDTDVHRNLSPSILPEGEDERFNDFAVANRTGAENSSPQRFHSRDSFGDSVIYSSSPGFTSIFDEEGALIWQRVGAGSNVPNHHDFTKVGVTATLHRSDLLSFDLPSIAAYTFRDKLVWFLERMNEIQKPWTEGFVRIEIRRSRILDDSFRAWMQLNREDLHKWMRYQFRGEAGVDAGGLEREWFELLCEEIFRPSNGFFVSSGGIGGYNINPLSGVSNPHHLSYFRFIGRILGKATMQQHSLNASLSLPLRKQIVGMPVTLSDLEFVDEELYKNLKWLQNQTEDISTLALDFTVTYTTPKNEQLTFELTPNGSEIMVTNENKSDYLQLRLKHRLLDSIKLQLENLLIGLYELIPPDILSVFDYQEFDLLLCGVPYIDSEDWRRHTEYLGEYSKLGERHHIVKWFWLLVEEMTQEERARLLHFTTGSSRLPIQGFKALQSTDGKYRKFNIQSIPKSSSLYPRAHTCFNKLDLPLYESRNELEVYLSYVINLGSVGFNME